MAKKHRRLALPDDAAVDEVRHGVEATVVSGEDGKGAGPDGGVKAGASVGAEAAEGAEAGAGDAVVLARGDGPGDGEAAALTPDDGEATQAGDGERAAGPPADDAEPTPRPADDAEPTPQPADDAEPTPQPADDAEPTPQPADEAEPTPQPADEAEPTPQPADEAEPTPQPADEAEPTPQPADEAEPTPQPADADEPAAVPPLANDGHPSPADDVPPPSLAEGQQQSAVAPPPPPPAEATRALHAGPEGEPAAANPEDITATLEEYPQPAAERPTLERDEPPPVAGDPEPPAAPPAPPSEGEARPRSISTMLRTVLARNKIQKNMERVKTANVQQKRDQNRNKNRKNKRLSQLVVFENPAVSDVNSLYATSAGFSAYLVAQAAPESTFMSASLIQRLCPCLGDGDGAFKSMQTFSVPRTSDARLRRVVPDFMPGRFTRRIKLHHDIAIRPSFFWSADKNTETRRSRALEMKELKNDCQDEALFIPAFSQRGGWAFAGVFDGHGPGGRNAAKFARRVVSSALAQHPSFQKAVGHGAGEGATRYYLEAIKATCDTVQELMTKSDSDVDSVLSGTTACFCVLADHGRLLTGCVGDSAAILVSDAEELESDGGTNIVVTLLSKSADPGDAMERRRIESNNGSVRSGEEAGAPMRVYRRNENAPGLAMSRSFGDELAHSAGVISTPFVQEDSVCAETDRYLVLASDGLWDVFGFAEAAVWIEDYLATRTEDMDSVASALTREAQQRWTQLHKEIIVDDISIVVVFLRPPPEPKPKAPLAKGTGKGWKNVRSALLGKAVPPAAKSNDEANSFYKSQAMMPEEAAMIYGGPEA